METRHWACECGERFKSNGALMAHQKQVKAQGQLEGHSLRGLIDDESGEVLSTSMTDAISKGLVEVVRADVDEEGYRRSTLPTHVYVETVEIDASVFILYDATRKEYPNYTKSKGEWIVETITNHYREHPELGLLQFFMRIAAGPGLGGEVITKTDKEDGGGNKQEGQTSDASGAAQPEQGQGAETPVGAAQ